MVGRMPKERFVPVPNHAPDDGKESPDMRYAFMTFSCPDLTLTEALEVGRRYGYDGIEPRIEEGHHHGIEVDTPADRRTEARRMAGDAGIALCCIATSRT